MALRTPPSWLQNGSHPAENDRLSMQSIIATTGIIGTSSLAVTQPSSPALAVQVAAGWGAIVGDYQTNMGVYQFYNDAATQLSVTTASISLPRIDRVVVTINDSYYTGATNNVTFTVIAGTPNASPTAPATPTNSLSLATIAVAAGAAQIINANITDTRVNITTNLPVGDLTEVASGTGITVTNGTGPIPSVAINTAVTADLTTAQTLTNKTLTTPIISSISNSGTVTVPTGTDTLVGRATTDTLTNKTLTAPVINLSLNAQTGTTYTFVLTDNGKLVTASNAAAQTYTIPPNSSVAYATGAQINIIAIGAGQVSFAAGSGVTIASTGATATAPKLRVQYSSATCIKVATDTWYIAGDIS